MWQMPRVPRVSDAFELLIAWLCLVSGLPMALGAPPPSSVQRSLPPWLVHCWGGVLALGGLLIVAGIVLRRRSNVRRRLLGLRIEGAGLAPLAAGSAVLGLVIASVAGWPGVFAAGTYVMFAVACVLRAVEIRDIERGLRGAVSRSREQQ